MDTQHRAIKAILIAFAGGLYACSPAPAPEPKTVTYYRQHEGEAQAVLKRCGEDPGRLRGTPDCVNAGAAMLSLQGQRKYKPVQF